MSSIHVFFRGFEIQTFSKMGPFGETGPRMEQCFGGRPFFHTLATVLADPWWCACQLFCSASFYLLMPFFLKIGYVNYATTYNTFIRVR